MYAGDLITKLKDIRVVLTTQIWQKSVQDKAILTSMSDCIFYSEINEKYIIYGCLKNKNG